jgi:asparagine synthase (glutamine-hydrolysing)
MCGVCGIVNFDGSSPDQAAISLMMTRLQHRGPDDHGSFAAPGIGLGFVRLSIVDLSSAGHQPMTVRAGRYTIAFNGEVYNHAELREELEAKGIRFISKTDTEVVVQAFAEWGVTALTRFNGMFAFAIYDAREQALFLARDRFGVKPLYYLQGAGQLAFASEIQALLGVLAGSQIGVDDQAVFDYLAFERVDPGDGTFYTGIRKLPAGHYLELRSGTISKHRWYRLADNIGNAFEDPEEYRELFASAVRYTTRGDVPIGVSLSGGLDSSSIVGTLIHGLGRRDFPTFSAVYGAGERGDESRYIHEFSPLLANMHEVKPSAHSLFEDLPAFVRAQGEPVTRTGPYAQYKVMELAQRHVKVTLEGQGADEVLAGYHPLLGFYYRALFLGFKWQTLAREFIATHRAGGSLTGFSAAARGLAPSALQAKASVTKHALAPDFIARYLPTSTVPGLFMMPVDLRGALINMVEHKLEHLLKWTDLNSMRFSIESRVPFLDHRLVERTLALHPSWVVRNGLTKYVLREAMAGFVPPAILARRDKVGFGTPEAEWFRAPAFRTLIGDLLQSRFFAEQPYVEPKRARAIFRRHLAGETNAARQIWKWTNLCLWHREFVSARQNSEPTRSGLVGVTRRGGIRVQPSMVEPTVGASWKPA